MNRPGWGRWWIPNGHWSPSDPNPKTVYTDTHRAARWYGSKTQPTKAQHAAYKTKLAELSEWSKRPNRA